MLKNFFRIYINLGNRGLIIFLLWKWIKYIFALKRCLEFGVLLWNQLELVYSLCKKIGGRPLGATFLNFFLLFILGKNALNQNYVEFDWSIGHALLFFFWMNKKCTVDHVHSPNTPLKTHIYIYIYFEHKTFFSPNLMIIITGTFRNTSNYMK